MLAAESRKSATSRREASSPASLPFAVGAANSRPPARSLSFLCRQRSLSPVRAVGANPQRQAGQKLIASDASELIERFEQFRCQPSLRQTACFNCLARRVRSLTVASFNFRRQLSSSNSSSSSRSLARGYFRGRSLAWRRQRRQKRRRQDGATERREDAASERARRLRAIRRCRPIATSFQLAASSSAAREKQPLATRSSLSLSLACWRSIRRRSVTKFYCSRLLHSTTGYSGAQVDWKSFS